MLATDTPKWKETEERKRQKEEKKMLMNVRQNELFMQKLQKLRRIKWNKKKTLESETSQSESEIPPSPGSN